jgi:hypothetical protein
MYYYRRQDLSLTDEQVYQRVHGELYFNVITRDFRLGEIAGRIIPVE